MAARASPSSQDLLPSTAGQFSKQSYWEHFFGKRGAAAFEWYGEWNDLHEHVEPHLGASSRVLVIGCGNSDFSEQMWANGYRHLLSIDYSGTVIKQMKAKSLARHGGVQPEGLRYEEMDLHDIKAADGAFDVIMDKACLDALVTDPSLAVFRDVSSMIDETLRVLTSDGGKYICVTLAQTHVLKFLLTKFAVGWEGVVTQAVSVEAQASLSSFVFVFTRRADISATQPTTLTIDLDETDFMFGADGRKKAGQGRDVAFVELGLEEQRRSRRPAHAFRFGGGVGKRGTATASGTSATAGGDTDAPATVRLAAFEKVAARLDGARKMLYAQKELKQLQFSGGMRHSAQIFASGTGGGNNNLGMGMATMMGGAAASRTTGANSRIPRYEISVVDRTGGPADGQPSVAVLLVHPSRFQDFEFAKEEGQQQVADSTGYGRLVFVRLHPAHEFNLDNGMAAVQAELGSLVKPLFPSISAKKREKVPYLAIGEDADPSRVRVSQLSSTASGDIIIEECDDPASESEPPQRVRQLIFLAQLGTVQTEMRLLRAPQGKKKATDRGSSAGLAAVDHSYLAFELHRMMVAGLSLVAPSLFGTREGKASGSDVVAAATAGGGGGDGQASTPSKHVKMTVLGLGGGALVMFLRKHFDAHVQVVELDPTVVHTAREYFGFIQEDAQDPHVELFVEDGELTELTVWAESIHLTITAYFQQAAARLLFLSACQLGEISCVVFGNVFRTGVRSEATGRD